MPRGPKGEKRPADVIGAVVHVMRIATGEILSMLCEGSSMRSISRVGDVSINTVAKLLVNAGKACRRRQVCGHCEAST